LSFYRTLNYDNHTDQFLLFLQPHIFTSTKEILLKWFLVSLFGYTFWLLISCPNTNLIINLRNKKVYSLAEAYCCCCFQIFQTDNLFQLQLTSMQYWLCNKSLSKIRVQFLHKKNSDQHLFIFLPNYKLP
jgi:hypothetical protein